MGFDAAGPLATQYVVTAATKYESGHRYLGVGILIGSLIVLWLIAVIAFRIRRRFARPPHNFGYGRSGRENGSEEGKGR